MPPLLITSSSCCFPQEPPMWTKTDLSSKRSLSLSTFLSAIHVHLSFESASTSFSWLLASEAPFELVDEPEPYSSSVTLFNQTVLPFWAGEVATYVTPLSGVAPCQCS